MAKNGKFEGRYEIEDGYVGGSRPQYFTIDADDLSGFDADDVDGIENLFHELAHEDMLNKVSTCGDTEEFVAWAQEQIRRRDAEGG